MALHNTLYVSLSRPKTKHESLSDITAQATGHTRRSVVHFAPRVILIAHKERQRKNYLGVEILPSKILHISVRRKKARCSNLVSRQISVVIAESQAFTVTKSSLANDFVSYINYSPHKLKNDEQKIAYLHDILKSPPAFVVWKGAKVQKKKDNTLNLVAIKGDHSISNIHQL